MKKRQKRPGASKNDNHFADGKAKAIQYYGKTTRTVARALQNSFSTKRGKTRICKKQMNMCDEKEHRRL